jgi:putative FmdB family regulatory protein
MPVYEYRCNSCGRKASLFYKTYRDYDAAEGSRACPHCGATALTRLISRVGIAKPGRDYSRMSSDEMLNVLEGGDSREVGRMMHQLGQDEAINDPAFSDVTERLMKGEDPEKIDTDLGGGLPGGGLPAGDEG